VVEYAPRGSLQQLLADETIPLSWAQRYKFAKDIATGMAYLNQYPDEAIHINDNLKVQKIKMRKQEGVHFLFLLQSNNVLITKEWDAKLTDFGQSSVKELARTMTSITTISWTGTPYPHSDRFHSFFVYLFFLKYLFTWFL
jgi:serine/threonine protein kinase